MNHEYWYLSRATGFTAYLLLFASVALGILISVRVNNRLANRNLAFDLHRFTTILGLAFSLFHVYILLGDQYLHFSLWSLSVPFTSPYRGWQTAAGAFALWATVVVIASFYLRRFIGYRAWRLLHFATFAIFALAVLHGTTAGSDTGTTWARSIYLITGAITVGLVLYRVQHDLPESRGARVVRVSAGVGAAAVAAMLVLGTGLVQTRTKSDAAPSEAVSTYPFLASFSGNLQGTFSQLRGTNRTRLTIDGVTSGDLPASLHIDLVQSTAVPASDDETIERQPDDEQAEARPVAVVITNDANLADPGSGASLCAGSLTSLQNSQLQIECDGAGPYVGVSISMVSTLRAKDDGTLTGALSGTMRRTS